jgi:hypothetical protein
MKGPGKSHNVCNTDGSKGNRPHHDEVVWSEVGWSGVVWFEGEARLKIERRKSEVR